MHHPAAVGELDERGKIRPVHEEAVAFDDRIRLRPCPRIADRDLEGVFPVPGSLEPGENRASIRGHMEVWLAASRWGPELDFASSEARCIGAAAGHERDHEPETQVPVGHTTSLEIGKGTGDSGRYNRAVGSGKGR